MIESRGSCSRAQEPETGTTSCTHVRFLALLALQGWPVDRFSAQRVSSPALPWRSWVPAPALWAARGHLGWLLLGVVAASNHFPTCLMGKYKHLAAAVNSLIICQVKMIRT